MLDLDSDYTLTCWIDSIDLKRLDPINKGIKEMEVQRKQWLCPGGCGPTRDTVGLICYANWLLPICTGPSNVLHYTPFICCDLIMETDLVPAAVALIWQWLLRKMEFVPFLAPTLFSQEGAMGIFQCCLLDWDWHPFDFLHWTPPSLPSTPPSFGSQRICLHELKAGL